MGLTEDLRQLDQRRESGEITQDEQDAQKRLLLADCVRKIEHWAPKPAPAANKPQVFRGTVTSITNSALSDAVIFTLDDKKVKLSKVDRAVSIAAGDRVLIVGTLRDGSYGASLYINESNGDNSVDQTRKMIRKTWTAAFIGLAGAASVLATAIIAALRDPHLFSAAGGVRIAVYLISIAAAIAIAAVALFMFFAASFLHALIMMIEGRVKT